MIKMLVGVLLFTSCASQKLLRDQDYDVSLAAFRGGHPQKALEYFPKKESGGFITSVEKSWIHFWNNETDTSDLERQVRTFEDRKFLSVSREAEYFLFQESEEGYVPAEHEVVAMHLLLAMSFMRENKWQEAEVEARRATYYLQGFFNENQMHFDDPALRLWMAGVWSALGLWNEAQVDLRKAAELSKNSDLRKWAERPSPAFVILRFHGVGPQMRWVEGQTIPEFEDSGRQPKTGLSFSTLPWYQQHQERNSALRDRLMKSNYMAQYLGVKTGSTSEKAAGKAALVTWAGAGIALGAAIMAGGFYLLTKSSGSGEAAGYILGSGAAVMTKSVDEASSWDARFQRKVVEDEEKSLKALRTYRLVRFLPNWVSVEISDQSAPSEPISMNAQVQDFNAPHSKLRTRFVQEY